MATAEIIEGEFGDGSIQVVVGGFLYGFNLSGFDPASHKWLCDVLCTQMQDIHDRAFLLGQQDVRAHLQRALGVSNG